MSYCQCLAALPREYMLHDVADTLVVGYKK